MEVSAFPGTLTQRQFIRSNPNELFLRRFHALRGEFQPVRAGQGERDHGEADETAGVKVGGSDFGILEPELCTKAGVRLRSGA
jgi:hypothetical protein